MAEEQYYALCVEKEDGSTQIAFFELGGDALAGALGISVYTAPDGELQRRHLQDGQVVIVAKSPRDLLSVDVDTARYAGVHRLKKIPGALRGYNDLAVLQVPALQLAVGGGVDRDPQRPRERVSAEFKEGYLRRAVLLFYAERIVLFVRHAIPPYKSAGLLHTGILPLPGGLRLWVLVQSEGAPSEECCDRPFCAVARATPGAPVESADRLFHAVAGAVLCHV